MDDWHWREHFCDLLLRAVATRIDGLVATFDHLWNRKPRSAVHFPGGALCRIRRAPLVQRDPSWWYQCRTVRAPARRRRTRGIASSAPGFSQDRRAVYCRDSWRRSSRGPSHTAVVVETKRSIVCSKAPHESSLPLHSARWNEPIGLTRAGPSIGGSGIAPPSAPPFQNGGDRGATVSPQRTPFQRSNTFLDESRNRSAILVKRNRPAPVTVNSSLYLLMSVLRFRPPTRVPLPCRQPGAAARRARAEATCIAMRAGCRARSKSASRVPMPFVYWER